MSEEYTIVRSELPADTPTLQSVLTRSFGSAGMAAVAAGSSPSPEIEAFTARVRATRQQNAVEGRNEKGMRAVVGKAIHNRTGELVAMVSLLAPASASVEQQNDSFLPIPPVQDGETIPDGGQAVLDKLSLSDRQLEKRSEELMGDARNREWWYLSALATVPEHQRQGLGGKLVRWAIQQVKDDVEARRLKKQALAANEIPKDREVKGLWLVAAQGALKTYNKEGLVVIGEGWLGEEGKAKLFTWMTLQM